MQSHSPESNPFRGMGRRLPRYSLILLCFSIGLIPIFWMMGVLPLKPIHFMPHGMCYMWDPVILSLHVSSDTLIGLSYVAISTTLTYLVHRARRDIPFTWIFLAFGLFIVACGATHFMEIWTVWNPAYWFSGYVKVVTAVASVATAVVLPHQVPKVLALIAAQKLSEERKLQLEVANQELARMQEELEHRVKERTQELTHANELLQAEIAERARIAQERVQLLAREKEAREAAEAANRMKDEFLAVVSHELRTPMNAVLGWSRLLQSGKLSAEEAAHSLEIISRNAKSQARLVEDILEVSRIITGRLKLHYQAVNLAHLIETTVEGLRPAAEAKGLVLTVDLGAEAVEIVGDSERLRQVIWNLVSNAIKFTHKAGHVEIRLQRVESSAQITVSDTGVGIRPDFLPYIFDRFSQADSTSTRQYGGLGLGLAIVRHLVELHGGTVAAYSPGEGQGASFVISLPLKIATQEKEGEKAAAPFVPPALASHTLPTLNKLKVLVVEDDPDSRTLVKVILLKSGAEVRDCASVSEALAVLAEWQPEMLVSDIEMPGENGYNLIQKIRSKETGESRLPALALTAYGREEDQRKALAAGFQQHVTKPVEPTELLNVISRLAGQAGKG